MPRNPPDEVKGRGGLNLSPGVVEYEVERHTSPDGSRLYTETELALQIGPSTPWVVYRDTERADE